MIVLCAPLGAEAGSAYRALFVWARMLAAKGHAVLRFDHAGEGDSLALDDESDQWEHWLNGVKQAARLARSLMDQGELVLAGLRAGGLLAAAAAEEIAPDGIVLLAPVVTGSAWVRELRWSERLQTGRVAEEGEVAFSGLRLSPRTVARLEGVDLRRCKANWRRAFLALAPSMPDVSAHLGGNVAKTGFPGYSRLFQEAHKNQFPGQVFDWASNWLESWSEVPLGRLREPEPAEFLTEAWREQPFAFGPGLRGLLTLPRRPRSKDVLVLGNTAGDPRAGIGAFAARACRAMATSGMAALRFDFLGLGESADHPGGALHVYETKRTEEFSAAAAALKAMGFGEISLGGVCTGGYHAVRAVIDQPEFRRALAINSWLVWRANTVLEFPDAPAGTPRREWREFFSPAFWRDVRQGKVAWRRIARGVGERVARIRASFHPDGACAATRREIAAAQKRGAEIRLVFARGDVSLSGLEQDFGLRGAWLRSHGVTVRLRRELDHAVMSQKAQAAAMEEFADFLSAPALKPDAAMAFPVSGLPLATMPE